VSGCDESATDRGLSRAIAAHDRGVELRDAGRKAEAFAAWDELLEGDQVEPGTEAGLVVVQTLYAKAHYLMELERWGDAVIVARQAHEAALLQPGTEARLLGAYARGVLRDSLTHLDQLDAALGIDDAIAAEHEASDEFELRDAAARALAHAIWVLMSRKQEQTAITYAQRLIAGFRREGDPAHLARASENVLSSAATLDWRRSHIRRASQPVRQQATAMRETVIEQARKVGGEIGAAVVVNAKIAVADALMQDHRLREFISERRALPALQESELPFLDRVEEQARLAGAEGRYLQIAVVRAFTLEELGRTEEAISSIDRLLAHLDRERGSGYRGTVAFLRIARRSFESGTRR
jgi:tetratricopeptide (TPR) repeat protein